MMFDPYAVLARALEREESLLWNLKDLLTSVDQSSVGPASSLFPRWQLERVEAIIATSEEEIEMISDILENLDDDEFL